MTQYDIYRETFRDEEAVPSLSLAVSGLCRQSCKSVSRTAFRQYWIYRIWNNLRKFVDLSCTQFIGLPKQTSPSVYCIHKFFN